MLLSLFLPTYWKNKLLVAQTILSLNIRNGFFSACLSTTTAKKTVLNRGVSVELPKEKDVWVATIKDTLTAFKGYDRITIIESSESILFKEIDLPLTTNDQVELVLNEEIEPYLPFNPFDAHIGFIINDTNAEGISTILTATIKKNSAEELYAPFVAANFAPDEVTTDTQSLAELITKTHPLAQEASTAFLRIVIDIHATFTQLIFIYNGKLRTAKNIPLGTSFFSTTTEPKEGEQAQAPSIDVTKYTEFLNKVLFTCDAIALKYSQNTTEQSLFFMQKYAGIDVPGLLKEKSDHLIEFFTPSNLSDPQAFDISNGIGQLDWECIATHVGSAQLAQTMNHISLPVNAAEERSIFTIKKNITAALVVFAMIVGVTFVMGYQQLFALSKALAIAESTQLSKLNEKFPNQFALMNKPTLKRAITQIEEHVHEQQIFWNMFGAKNLNTLEIIYELTQLIDRRVFTVDVSKITIALSEEDHTPRITLEGTFVSKTDAHYSDFGIFEKHLAMSKRLTLVKETENSFADNAHGVKFTARFKLRDV